MSSHIKQKKNHLISLKDRIAILESENETLRKQTAAIEKVVANEAVSASAKVKNFFCEHITLLVKKTSITFALM